MPSNTAAMNAGDVRAEPIVPPAHMLAEKNEKPNMMMSIDHMPQRPSSCTAENS